MIGKAKIKRSVLRIPFDTNTKIVHFPLDLRCLFWLSRDATIQEKWRLHLLDEPLKMGPKRRKAPQRPEPFT